MLGLIGRQQVGSREVAPRSACDRSPAATASAQVLVKRLLIQSEQSLLVILAAIRRVDCGTGQKNDDKYRSADVAHLSTSMVDSSSTASSPHSRASADGAALE